MTRPAFRYHGDPPALVPCPDTGPSVLLAPPEPPPLHLGRRVELSHRERRRRARSGPWASRGRRRARPVPAVGYLDVLPYERLAPAVHLLRHTFRRHNATPGEAHLYLPAGERPTVAHGRDLDRALLAYRQP